MEAFLLAAQRSTPLWEKIRWGTAADWVGGLLTAFALLLTYGLLRQQAAALREQRAALADDRIERERVFFRTCAVTMRPVLREAREVCATITATLSIGRAWRDPLTNPLLRDLAAVRPTAAVDADLSRHVGDLWDRLAELWHFAGGSERDEYGNEILSDAERAEMAEVAARGLGSATAALQRLAALETPGGQLPGRGP